MEDTPKTAGQTAGEPAEDSMESLLSDQAELAQKLDSRQIAKVRVVQVLPDRILVDIGEKREGVVPISDFQPNPPPSPEQRIPVILERRGRGEQPTTLSHKKARAHLGWEALQKSHAAGERVKGRVVQWIKGGYRVDLEGLDAFMPLSQSELRTPPRHRLPVGAKVRCDILEMNVERRQVVVSRKKILEEEESKRRSEVLGTIKVGQTHRGWVSHVTESGMFVNIGGLEGLVHLQDVAWREPEKAKAAYTRGQRVSVKVVKVDAENGKVDLGIKQLTPNPADALKKKFPPKTIVKAKIGAVSAEGAKADVGSVPAWIAAEEFASDGPPKEGDVLQATVLGVRSGQFDLNLSAKRYEDMEDRKKIQKYLRKAPPLTLGQLLSSSSEEEK